VPTPYKTCLDSVHSDSIFHKARKSFVSSALDGDVNINTVRQMVGHTDERTTLNNYCYDRSTDEEKLRKLAAALG
jgi:integrase